MLVHAVPSGRSQGGEGERRRWQRRPVPVFQRINVAYQVSSAYVTYPSISFLLVIRAFISFCFVFLEKNIVYVPSMLIADRDLTRLQMLMSNTREADARLEYWRLKYGLADEDLDRYRH